MTSKYFEPYCFISGFPHFSGETTLLDDIRGALTGEEIDESQWDSDSDADTDTDTEARPAVRSTETIPLPESTKNALLIAEEIEWSRDLVWLKWRGTFKHSPLNAYGDEDIDDDDDDNHIQQKDPRISKMRNDIVPHEVRIHFNMRPESPGGYSFINDSTSSSPGSGRVRLRRDEDIQAIITNGSFIISQMATNRCLTPYALYMLHFDLRGPGVFEGPYRWEAATQSPTTNDVQRNYYIKDQFTADLQCDDCIFNIDALGLRSVDYGPMARAMSKTYPSLLSLPLPHPPYHHKVRTQPRKQYAVKSGPSDEQKHFWRNLFGSSDLSEGEKVKEAWIGSGTLWCIRRPDRFPIGKTLASPLLLTFNVDNGRDLTGLEALPWPIFHLLTSYLSPKDFWMLLYSSKSLHATLMSNIDKLVYASIRQTRPHLLPSTPLKIAGHEERRSTEEEYWVLEWAKGGIQLGMDDERNWRSGKDVDRIPWMRYAREAARCPSMRNRRRIWGIALQLEELAERAGYI